MLLQPFIEKLARNLNSEDIIFQFDRIYWKEPRFVTLVMDIILDNLKAIVPHLSTSPFHAITPVPILLIMICFACFYLPLESQGSNA